jgi:putative secretion ATPase (PEP-CTERM system associated)
MYESHFGLSGPPFQLIPDPSFYFSSRGHSNALAFLKFGAHQGEGFIVVTGEIGAGKTTLVRTLLEGLDPAKVAAAPVVSAQLEPGDLPLAILMAFGVTVAVQNSAQLIADLEAFLTDLSAKGRRALLIIDEAQNLAPAVIEELRVLTNFQLGKNAMLQVFLIGQPELRTMLQSKAMDQLRQRVTASCHLGPLDATETRAYVQHRLHLVGWNDNPRFDLDAFQQVHRWTGGIPRRINRLCNRLLLAAFLETRDAITAENVEQIAQDLRAEIGETDDVPPLDAAAVPAFETSTIQPTGSVEEPAAEEPELDVHLNAALPTASTEVLSPQERHSQHAEDDLPADAAAIGVVAAHEPSGFQDLPTLGDAFEPTPNAVARAAHETSPDTQVDAPTPLPQPLHEVAVSGGPVAAHVPAGVVAAALFTPAGPPREPIICLVDTAADYVKARAFARILADHPKLPPVMTVHTGSAMSVDVGDGLSGVMPGSPSDVYLDVDDSSGAAGAAAALLRFDAVLKEHAPMAVLAMGASDMLLTCSLLAHKSNIPILRNDAGRRKAWAPPGEEMNAVLLERFADISYIADLATYYTLYRVGIPTDRVLCVGDLSDNVVRFASEHTVQPEEVLRRAGVATASLKGQKGYLLATLQLEPQHHPNQDAQDLVARLTLAGKELPVLWPVGDYTLQELKESGQYARLEGARIVPVAGLGYIDCIDLLRRARCLITDVGGAFIDEAGALGVPSLVLGKGIVVPMKQSEPQLNVAQGAEKFERLVADMVAAPVVRRPVPEYWDGGPAAKVAAHLETWLPKQVRARKPAKATKVAALTRATA